MTEPIVREINNIDRRLSRLEQTSVDVPVCRDNVSNPPTAAEVTTCFTTNVHNGFLGLINDNGAGNDIYLVARVGGKWWSFTGTELL